MNPRRMVEKGAGMGRMDVMGVAVSESCLGGEASNR